MTGRHTSEYKHNMDDRLDAVGMREGEIADMFLCNAGSNLNSKQFETEIEAKDDLSNALSLGIEKLKNEYEAKLRVMRRVAQAADGRCKISEKEKKDLDEKLRQAETEIDQLQKNYMENERLNTILRREIKQHMRECNAKQEKAKQMEETESIFYQIP